MPKELSTDSGKITISEDVVATIAGVAATECYGIVGMASRKIKDGIAELLGRESLSRGVEVAMEGDSVSVSIYVVVGYGTRISEVAKNVIEQVRYKVQSSTGLSVRHIDIRVQGVKGGSLK
ncbi:MAG: Asp23/Gls24 family envelope stress response protein [Bacillota bacterium]|nr:Asp23/Gls24 family envelope stress response protein [Bacillota bacterium]